MKKTRIKNLIAFLMAMVLMFSMIPFTVFAATTPPSITYNNKFDYSKDKYIMWAENDALPQYKTGINENYVNAITNIYINDVEVTRVSTYDDFTNASKSNYKGWFFGKTYPTSTTLTFCIGNYNGITGNGNLDQYITKIKIVATGYDDLIINPVKNPPTITADSTDLLIPYGETHLQNNIELTFPSNPEWQGAISKIYIDDVAINADKYDVTVDGKVILNKSLFTSGKYYTIKISATGYLDTNACGQKITAIKAKLVEGGEYIYQPIVLEVSDLTWLNAIGDKIYLLGTNSSGKVTSTSEIIKSTTPIGTKPTFYISNNKIYISPFSMNFNNVNKVYFSVTKQTSTKNLFEYLEICAPKNKGDTQQINVDTTTNYLGGKINLKMYYTPVNKADVIAYRDAIFTIAPSDTSKDIYPYSINTAEDNEGNGTITITVDTSSEVNKGNICLCIFAKGYNSQSVYQNLKEVATAPTIKLAKLVYYSGEDMTLSYSNDDNQYFDSWYKALTKVTISPSSGLPIDLDLNSQITFNPDAKSITIPAKVLSDKNITSGSILLYSKGYSMQNVSFSYSSSKPSPLVSPMSNAATDEDVSVTFADNEDWRNAVTSITIDGKDIDSSKYKVSAGKIVFDKSLFAVTENKNSFLIKIKATNYADVSLTQGFGTGTSKDSFDNTKFTADEQTKTYLQVIYGDKTYNFTKAELYKLTAAEGNKFNTYSTYNTWPTYSIKTNVIGPTIKGILQEAGIDIASLDDNQTIKTVSGGDGMTNSFTVESLFRTTRYFYPKGSDPKLYETYNIFRGGVHDSSYWEGKQEVPAVINLDYDEGTLMFGQIYPNEQTNFAFDKYMVKADGSSAPGKIIIGTKDKEATKMETPTLQNGSPISGSAGVEGKVLDFGECGYGKMLVYTVSTDGTEPKDPTYLDTIYDYASFRNLYNKYTLTNTPTIVKFRYVSTVRTANTNELLDSDVITIYYNGASPESKQSNKIEIGDGSITATSNYNYSDVFTADEMSQIYSDKAAGKDTAASTSLKIKAITAPSETDVANAKKALNDRLKSGQSGAVLMYFDIELFKTLNGKANTQVTDLNGKEITITLDIPSEYLKDGRYFYLAQIHDGKTTVLEDLDNNPNTITVKIGKFSTYALAYSVGKLEEPTATTNITGDSTPKASATTTTTTTTTKSSLKAKTGDNSMIISSIVLVLGASAALGFIEQKRRKEDNN